ncbi:5712_t:CDS:2, partial [Gigaspora margarita]
MEQYSSDEMEITIPPERLKIWNTRHILVTHDKAYFYTNDDNSSFWLKDNEFIIKKKTKDYQLWTRVIIKPGQANSYWKSEDMIKQLHVYCFDQSTNYNAYALDVLVCSRMTLHPKVEPKFKFKDTYVFFDKSRNNSKGEGIMKFKEIKKNSQKLDYKRKEGDEKEQKTSIAEIVEAARHIFELYPKFHCECNFIECFWDAAKRIA